MKTGRFLRYFVAVTVLVSALSGIARAQQIVSLDYSDSERTRREKINANFAAMMNRTVFSVFGRSGFVTAQTGDYSAIQVTNAADLTAANVFDHVLTISIADLQQTQIDGLALVNPTHADADHLIQNSPAIQFTAHAWGVGADVTYNAQFLLSPGKFVFRFQKGDGYIERASIDTAGNMIAHSYTGIGAGLTNLNASELASGMVPAVRMGTGSTDTTTFLRGDRAWAAISSLPFVTTVFGRGPGAVTASSGDYTAAQVTNAADVTAANTFSAFQSVAMPNLLATQINGLGLINSTAADAGHLFQNSPALHFEGHIWTGVADVAHKAQVLLQQNAAGNPAMVFFFQKGGSYQERFSIDSNGIAVFAASVAAPIINATGPITGGSIRGTAVTFGSLPGLPFEGMMVPVTDSTTATWGAIITGGGSNHVLAYYNGTNWTVAAK